MPASWWPADARSGLAISDRWHRIFSRRPREILFRSSIAMMSDVIMVRDRWSVGWCATEVLRTRNYVFGGSDGVIICKDGGDTIASSPCIRWFHLIVSENFSERGCPENRSQRSDVPHLLDNGGAHCHTRRVTRKRAFSYVMRRNERSHAMVQVSLATAESPIPETL